MYNGYEHSAIIEAQDTLVENWGDAGKKIIEIIFNHTDDYVLRMTCDEFLQSCTACGGNWGGMLLSGIKRLAPEVYDAIPDNMGTYAWETIIATLTLMRVEF